MSKLNLQSIRSPKGGQFPLKELRRWAAGLFVWAALLAVIEVVRATGAVEVDLATTLVAFVVLGVTLLLIAGVYRGVRSLEDAVVDFIVPGAEDTSVPFEHGQSLIYQEVRRARRYNRALSLVSVRVDPSAAQIENRDLFVDVQEAVLWRHANAQLARMLDSETNGCQVMTERDDHFVVLLPETDRSGALALMSRLRGQARAQLGMELEVGISSFPEENVTFTRLLEAAENEMFENREGRGAGELSEYAPEASARG